MDAGKVIDVQIVQVIKRKMELKLSKQLAKYTADSSKQRTHDPTHQVRHICKAHKADTQKLTLQKSLPCANASGTHPTSLDTGIQFDTP